jgi:hypothetical protein
MLTASLCDDCERALLSLLKTSYCRPLASKFLDMCIANLSGGVSVGQSLRIAKQLLESMPEFVNAQKTDRYGSELCRRVSHQQC